MKSSEIKVIIANLIPIKQQIHPSEIRCCRDNALRDINHPFYTIYYKNKEVAFVGTPAEISRSVALVESEITREKRIKENIFSINYLIPECDKQKLSKIKERIERDYKHTKLIIYDPNLQRKNISITLSSDYVNFDKAYSYLQTELDALRQFPKTFESFQKNAIYQMCKYFFKYLQNFFQTRSTIFMKAWDTITYDFLMKHPLQNSLFEKVKYNYSKDHELKFYILSVSQMFVHPLGQPEQYGVTKSTLIEILRYVVNKQILFDRTLHNKNFQSIFSFDSQTMINLPDGDEDEGEGREFEFPQGKHLSISSFLNFYKPKRYADRLRDSQSRAFGSLEELIQNKVMTKEELDHEKRENRRERERKDELGQRLPGSSVKFERRTSREEVPERFAREQVFEKKEDKMA